MLRTRLSLTQLEERETPSGTDPLDPNGGTTTPSTVPAQLPPADPTTAPPTDPHGGG
jgi:hypothetical protein